MTDAPKTDTAPEAPESSKTAPDAPEGQNGPQNGPDAPETAPAPAPKSDTFPAAVVKELRDENAKLRIRGKKSDELKTRLAHALAAQTGRLADPTDLPVSDDLLDDDGYPSAAKVSEAVDALLAVLSGEVGHAVDG